MPTVAAPAMWYDDRGAVYALAVLRGNGARAVLRGLERVLPLPLGHEERRKLSESAKVLADVLSQWELGAARVCGGGGLESDSLLPRQVDC